MRCQFCEQDKTGLPFRCNYCGGYFCSEHRLPENHSCVKVGGPKQPGYSQVSSIKSNDLTRSRDSTFRDGAMPWFKLRGSGLVSKEERKDVVISAFLIEAVGISMTPLRVIMNPVEVMIVLVGFLVSFFGHEFSHKLFAQRNGLWAKYKTSLYGLLITALSIPFAFKFLAPGQVVVVGDSSKRLSGSIALIGPSFNILFGFLCLVLGFATTLSSFGYAFVLVGIFNGYMAIFNLIPLPYFDGQKAFDWDKRRWAISLASSIGLIGITILLIGSIPRLI